MRRLKRLFGWVGGEVSYPEWPEYQFFSPHLKEIHDLLNATIMECWGQVGSIGFRDALTFAINQIIDLDEELASSKDGVEVKKLGGI